MKIIFIEPFISTNAMGGAQKSLLHLMMGLKKKKHDVILAIPGDSDLTKKAKGASIQVEKYFSREDVLELKGQKIFSNKKMKFNLLSKDSILKANQYGIKEIENTEYLEPDLFNTMFIPFVGVDINGCRLGYGGGYFDRALEGISLLNKRPLIIGMGFDYQIVNEEFGMSYDVKYDIVITETRVLSFN